MSQRESLQVWVYLVRSGASEKNSQSGGDDMRHGNRRTAAALLVLGTALTPSAAYGYGLGECSSGQACTFVSDSYAGMWTEIYGGVNDYSNIALNPFRVSYANDTANSVAAYGNSCRLRYYEHANQTGSHLYFDKPGDAGAIIRDPALANGGGVYVNAESRTEWRDRISSHLWVNCT